MTKDDKEEISLEQYIERSVLCDTRGGKYDIDSNSKAHWKSERYIQKSKQNFKK